MPKITIIMHTDGNYPRYIEAAIYSVLNQTFRDFQLLINTSRMSFRLDKNYPNIKIVRKEYDGFIDQMASSFEHIDSPFWCVVDSDDYILPNHLENFMRFREFPEFSRYNCIGYKTILKSMYGNIRKKIRAGWVRFLYDRIEPDIVRALADKYTRPCGFDRAVDNMRIWRRGFMPPELGPTYLYRRREAHHISERVRLKMKLQRPTGDLRILTPKPIRDDAGLIKEAAERLEAPPIKSEQTRRRKCS